VPPSAPDPATARGCSHPVRLRSVGVNKATGEVLAERPAIYMPCGSRRASGCPSCAEIYNADAFHLIRLGLLTRHTATALPLFVTLTAPGADVFGTGHHFRSLVHPSGVGGREAADAPEVPPGHRPARLTRRRPA
jgi:hypothetical protein